MKLIFCFLGFHKWIYESGLGPDLYPVDKPYHWCNNCFRIKDEI